MKKLLRISFVLLMIFSCLMCMVACDNNDAQAEKEPPAQDTEIVPRVDEIETIPECPDCPECPKLPHVNLPYEHPHKAEDTEKTEDVSAPDNTRNDDKGEKKFRRRHQHKKENTEEGVPVPHEENYYIGDKHEEQRPGIRIPRQPKFQEKRSRY